MFDDNKKKKKKKKKKKIKRLRFILVLLFNGISTACGLFDAEI